MALQKALQADVEDEKEAVQNYGTRTSQLHRAGQHAAAKTVGHIRSEERRHAKTLTRVKSQVGRMKAR